MKKNLYDYCVEYEREELLHQWHPTKNKPLTPQTLTYGSKKRIWWRCEFGHEWQTALYMRTTSGTGCPFCAGKQVWPGETDLASQLPELAAQWHPTKNKNLTPDQVTVGSPRKVWWRCEFGHEWQAAVKARSNSTSCPICMNRVLLPGKNDLATVHPLLAQEWHPKKNGSLTPNNVLSGSKRKVWWVCEKGHEWQASIDNRITHNSGCPVCAGKVIIPGENDLASSHPELVEEWHPTKNHLTPQQVSPYSNRKVWWYCKLGHEYTAVVANRTFLDHGCPYCAGRMVLAGFNDLATREPQIAQQWHSTLNGSLKPDMVTPGSNKKVWWQCQDGHVWKAFIYSRATGKKHGCPVCAGRVSEKQQNKYLEIELEKLYKEHK